MADDMSGGGKSGRSSRSGRGSRSGGRGDRRVEPGTPVHARTPPRRHRRRAESAALATSPELQSHRVLYVPATKSELKLQGPRVLRALDIPCETLQGGGNFRPALSQAAGREPCGRCPKTHGRGVQNSMAWQFGTASDRPRWRIVDASKWQGVTPAESPSSVCD